MFNNPDFHGILSLVTTTAYMYVVAISIFYANSKSLKSNDGTLSILFLAGLPPFPTFFTKLWVLGEISTGSMNFIFIILVIFNIILVRAYIDFLIYERKATSLPSNKEVSNNLPTIELIIALTIAFILAPEMFKIC